MAASDSENDIPRVMTRVLSLAIFFFFLYARENSPRWHHARINARDESLDSSYLHDGFHGETIRIVIESSSLNSEFVRLVTRL